MDIELTKDSEYLLCTLYAKYKEQIQNGVPKRTAKCFGSSKDIFNSIFAEWNYEDVDETCCELMRVGFFELHIRRWRGLRFRVN